MSDPRQPAGPEDSGHPETNRLAAWMRGQLSATESAPIESHLESCDACAQRLDEFDDPQDPFVRRLRSAGGLARGLAEGPAEPAPSADTNLLFGALALQAGFLTAQQFADACVLWSSRGGAPLADLLIEQQWIDEEARASIAGLLAARLRQNTKRPAAETLSGRERTGRDLGDTLVPTSAADDRLRLKELHSQGGIGQVWLAQDTVLGREVALKELLPELRGSRSHRDRFFREARVGAQLAHPGTAPVYEYREEGGRCYYTMKFYGGRTYSEVIRDAHAPAATAEDGAIGPFERLFPLLEQFLSICETIAYAHSRGIVHRDLKGENVLLGDFGEVTVIDWGLAKPIVAGAGAVTASRDSASDSKTLEGERLGTPGYMAPEQARGDLAAIDERTDVYGLAAVLYEVLTTRPPFSGQTANEVMHRVEVSPPAPPSLSHPDTPAALEAICLRGLAKLKEERYQSAAELRDAVRGWLAHQVHQQQESDRQAKFFALSQDLFVALDDRGFIKQVNPAYSRFFGFDPTTTPGKHYSESLHPDDADRAKRMFQQVQRGVSQKDTVIRISDAAGEYRSVSWTVTRVPGEPTMYAVGRPLDEQSVRRRQADERSRFFALSRNPCVTLDGDRRITQVNRAWTDLFGFPEEVALGNDVLKNVHPDDLPRIEEQVRNAERGGSAQDIVLRLKRSDDEYVLTSWTLTRVAGEQTMYAIGRVLDEPTERRRSMESRARFFSLSPDLFVISDERGNAAQINDAWRRVLGWTADDVIGTPFSDFVHPDDVAPASRAGRRALLREAVVNLETRVRCRDGGYRTIAWTLCRVPGDRVNYALGRDITDAKLAEERLRAILDTGPEALMMVDANGRIEFANRILNRLFGYDHLEIEGQPLESLMPEAFRERHREVFADYMRSPVVRSMGRGAKFPAVRKDGSQFLVQIALSPLLLSDGRLSILAAVQPDYDTPDATAQIEGSRHTTPPESTPQSESK